ncbi:MAG: hypothetical protein GY755_01110 [Chloroflexi bacterium]|nr:hypothetical protein [Chloroflexota bacterium]
MKSKFILLTTIIILLLSACEFPSQTEEPAPEPAPLAEVEVPEVVEPEPEEIAPETDEEEAAPEPTATFTPTPTPCVELLSPLNLADLPAEGKVVFSWEAHPEADSYSLNFIFPDGLTLEFATNETTKNRYMDGFSMHPAYNQSGEHQWNVNALNAAGEELCQSDLFTFTKHLSGGASEGASQGDGGGNSEGVEGPPGGNH